MPNWRFSGAIVSDINSRAQVLADTQAKWIWDRCPLSFDQLQTLLVPDPTVWDALTTARDAGVEVPQASSFSLIFSAKLWPEIQRSAALTVTAPTGQKWWAPKTYGFHVGYEDGRADDNWGRKKLGAYVSPDQIEDDETRQQLVQWVNMSVRNARLRGMAKTAVHRMMGGLESTGQLLATWPFLATLCTDPFWTNRFRSPPIKLHNYHQPQLSLVVNHVTREATEVFLTGASMLEPYKPDNTRVHAALSVYNPVANPEDYAP